MARDPERKMEILKSLEIIRRLAEGLNRFTGEVLPDDSPYQHAEVLRALYRAIEILEMQRKRERKRKQLPVNAGRRWNEQEDSELVSGFKSGMTLRELAGKYKRTAGAIESRLQKLGTIEIFGVRAKR